MARNRKPARQQVFRGAILACLVVALGACDPERLPNGPTGEVATFTAVLASSNQPTLVVGAEANGTGTATLSIVISRNAGGAISNASADVSVNIVGYPSSTVISSAELRRGDAGTTGPVLLDLGVAPGSVPISGGIGTMGASAQFPSPLVQEMLNQPSSFYLTVATVANPNGVARGQFTRQ